MKLKANPYVDRRKLCTHHLAWKKKWIWWRRFTETLYAGEAL